MRARKRPPIFCLPPGVVLTDFSFVQSWEEREFDRYYQMKIEYDRQWLANAVQRMALVALEIDETARKIALQEEQDRVDAWHKAEAEDNAKLLTLYQAALDKRTLEAKLKRLDVAAKDIARTDRRIEKAELKRRGVLRGSR
jgi:hypothetical protein